jgi:hypothetical protein
MKQRLRIHLALAFSLLLMIPMLGLAQSQSSNGTQPAPYPRLKSSGSPEATKKQHEADVKKWQEQERLRNERLKSGVNTKSTPSDNQKKRIAEKEAGVAPGNVKSSPKKNERERTIVDLPGYPKYVYTGNPQLDEKNYQLAKTKWMNENPGLYEKYLKENRISGARSKRITPQSK